MDVINTFKKDLGVKNKQLAKLSSKPNCVSSQTESTSKKVKPIQYSVSAKEQMNKVVSVVSNMPGAKIKQQTGVYLYAVFMTKIMRFKDDVEIFLDEDEKLLHFRSASRLGYSDLGVNRKRYNAFASAFK